LKFKLDTMQWWNDPFLKCKTIQLILIKLQESSNALEKSNTWQDKKI